MCACDEAQPFERQTEVIYNTILKQLQYITFKGCSARGGGTLQLVLPPLVSVVQLSVTSGNWNCNLQRKMLQLNQVCKLLCSLYSWGTHVTITFYHIPSLTQTRAPNSTQKAKQRHNWSLRCHTLNSLDSFHLYKRGSQPAGRNVHDGMWETQDEHSPWLNPGLPPDESLAEATLEACEW